MNIIYFRHTNNERMVLILHFLSIIESMGEENGFQPLPTGFMTKAIHVGQDPEQWNSLSVIPPITMSTTFKQHGPAEFKVNNTK